MKRKVESVEWRVESEGVGFADYFNHRLRRYYNSQLSTKKATPRGGFFFFDYSAVLRTGHSQEYLRN